MATTKREFLNELVKANDLIVEEDIFKLQRGGKSIPIITRTGIEKIQYTNEIKVILCGKIKLSTNVCSILHLN